MPSFAQKTVPHLKGMFMADACHLNFGKYTLFSCYGVTANENMSPVAFAILFGNECGYAWKQFLGVHCSGSPIYELRAGHCCH